MLAATLMFAAVSAGADEYDDAIATFKKAGQSRCPFRQVPWLCRFSDDR
jgi:hypothetical protein